MNKRQPALSGKVYVTRSEKASGRKSNFCYEKSDYNNEYIE